MTVKSREQLERLMEALEHPDERPVSNIAAANLKEYLDAWKEKDGTA